MARHHAHVRFWFLVVLTTCCLDQWFSPVSFVSITHRWTSGPSSTNEGESEEIHSYACRNDSKCNELRVRHVVEILVGLALVLDMKAVLIKQLVVPPNPRGVQTP